MREAAPTTAPVSPGGYARYGAAVPESVAGDPDADLGAGLGPAAEQLVRIAAGRVVHPSGEALVVTVSGEVDVLTVGRLRAAVAAGFDELPDGATLVIDLTAVTFLGLGGSAGPGRRHPRWPATVRAAAHRGRSLSSGHPSHRAGWARRPARAVPHRCPGHACLVLIPTLGLVVVDQVAGRRGDRNNCAPMPTMGNDDTLRPGTSSSDRRSGYREASRQPLRLQLPADPVAPSVVRHRVRHWLTASSWPAGQLEDLVLAISEAVSNAVEHAYLFDHPCPAMVDIDGEVQAAPAGRRRVTVIVRDHGRWRPPPIHDENRRRGIPLMRACMDTVTIGQPEDHRAGTSVVLRSRAVPSLLRC